MIARWSERLADGTPPMRTVIQPNIVMRNLTSHAGSEPSPRPGRSCIANAMSSSGIGARYARRGAGRSRMVLSSSGMNAPGIGRGRDTGSGDTVRIMGEDDGEAQSPSAGASAARRDHAGLLTGVEGRDSRIES